MPQQGKILVVRGGAIGDFILTLPALAALRTQFPQSRLEVLGYPHIVQLALLGGLADAIRSIEARSLAGFFARNGDLDEELKEYFAGFALIVSYLYDPDQIFQTNVARSSKAQFIPGPHRALETTGVHAAEVYLRPLGRLAIFEANTVPRLGARQAFSPSPSSGDAKEEAQLETSRTLAAHPGSGSESKNWPERKWGELLVRLIHDTDLDLLLVGGEAEEDRLERIAAPLPRSRVQIARSLPLTELARRLSGCVGFVGHDSGITHLAAAVGVPVLALWGETTEAVWRPQGDRVTIIRDSAGLTSLSVECVASALNRLLG